MSVVSATVCDLPMQIVSDRDRRRRRLFQIIWKPGLSKCALDNRCIQAAICCDPMPMNATTGTNENDQARL